MAETDLDNGGNGDGETQTEITSEDASENENGTLQTQTAALREVLARMRSEARDQAHWANEIELIIGK